MPTWPARTSFESAALRKNAISHRVPRMPKQRQISRRTRPRWRGTTSEARQAAGNKHQGWSLSYAFNWAPNFFAIAGR